MGTTRETIRETLRETIRATLRDWGEGDEGSPTNLVTNGGETVTNGGEPVTHTP